MLRQGSAAGSREERGRDETSAFDEAFTKAVRSSLEEWHREQQGSDGPASVPPPSSGLEGASPPSSSSFEEVPVVDATLARTDPVASSGGRGRQALAETSVETMVIAPSTSTTFSTTAAPVSDAPTITSTTTTTGLPPTTSATAEEGIGGSGALPEVSLASLEAVTAAMEAAVASIGSPREDSRNALAVASTTTTTSTAAPLPALAESPAPSPVVSTVVTTRVVPTGPAVATQSTVAAQTSDTASLTITSTSTAAIPALLLTTTTSTAVVQPPVSPPSGSSGEQEVELATTSGERPLSLAVSTPAPPVSASCLVPSELAADTSSSWRIEPEGQVADSPPPSATLGGFQREYGERARGVLPPPRRRWIVDDDEDPARGEDQEVEVGRVAARAEPASSETSTGTGGDSPLFPSSAVGSSAVPLAEPLEVEVPSTSSTSTSTSTPLPVPASSTASLHPDDDDEEAPHPRDLLADDLLLMLEESRRLEGPVPGRWTRQGEWERVGEIPVETVPQELRSDDEELARSMTREEARVWWQARVAAADEEAQSARLAQLGPGSLSRWGAWAWGMRYFVDGVPGITVRDSHKRRTPPRRSQDPRAARSALDRLRHVHQLRAEETSRPTPVLDSSTALFGSEGSSSVEQARVGERPPGRGRAVQEEVEVVIPPRVRFASETGVRPLLGPRGGGEDEGDEGEAPRRSRRGPRRRVSSEGGESVGRGMTLAEAELEVKVEGVQRARRVCNRIQPTASREV